MPVREPKVTTKVESEHIATWSVRNTVHYYLLLLSTLLELYFFLCACTEKEMLSISYYGA